jgi:hypothetical protein
MRRPWLELLPETKRLSSMSSIKTGPRREEESYCNFAAFLQSANLMPFRPLFKGQNRICNTSRLAKFRLEP